MCCLFNADTEQKNNTIYVGYTKARPNIKAITKDKMYQNIQKMSQVTSVKNQKRAEKLCYIPEKKAFSYKPSAFCDQTCPVFLFSRFVAYLLNR